MAVKYLQNWERSENQEVHRFPSGMDYVIAITILPSETSLTIKKSSYFNISKMITKWLSLIQGNRMNTSTENILEKSNSDNRK